jgi:hypothetical protein
MAGHLDIMNEQNVAAHVASTGWTGSALFSTFLTYSTYSPLATIELINLRPERISSTTQPDNPNPAYDCI